MKRVYSKPTIVTESLMISEYITAGCGVTDLKEWMPLIDPQHTDSDLGIVWLLTNFGYEVSFGGYTSFKNDADEWEVVSDSGAIECYHSYSVYVFYS